MTNDFKQDSVVKFFGNNPRSQKSLWSADKSFINGIMQSGDEIDSVIDETTNHCEINIGFNGNIKNLTVSVTKATSGSAS